MTEEGHRGTEASDSGTTKKGWLNNKEKLLPKNKEKGKTDKFCKEGGGFERPRVVTLGDRAGG